MNAEHMPWNASTFRGDLPEYRHTNIGHAQLFLDAFAFNTRCADIAYAYQCANQHMIQQQRSGTDSAVETPQESEGIKLNAQKSASIQLALWWSSRTGEHDTGSGHIRQLPPRNLSERYKGLSGVLSIACQDIVRRFSAQIPSETMRSISLEQSIRTILFHPSGSHSGSHSELTYQQSHAMAAVAATVWQFRIWESSILLGIAKEASEMGAFSVCKEDAVQLRQPFHILSGLTAPHMQEQFAHADMASERSFEPILAFVRAHKTVFEQRNTPVRRLIRYFQYT